jgi:septum site-determining protein MinC
MIKAKQKTVRIFDINIKNERDFFPYMDKNLVLLKEYMLVLSGDVTQKVTKYLESHNICFVVAEDCNLKIKTKSDSDTKSDIMRKSEQDIQKDVRKSTISSQQKAIIAQSPKMKTLVLERPVRSGEEIIHESDVTIFGRVNSASKVLAEGNVEVYGTIDGLVQCDGSYMIIKDLGKGHIIFNGDILEREQFNGNLKKITSTPSGVMIKDIF